MAITTYAELVTAIQSYMLGRSDLATPAPEFITLGEGVINYGFDGNSISVPALRVRDMETTSDLSPTNNVCTLPTDFLEYKRVVELASIRRSLDYISEVGADALYATRASGLSCHFTIVGNSLTALPLSSNDIELTYYAKVPALTASATTNWLLTKHPGIYLRASLFMAADWIKDTTEMVSQGSMLAGLINAFNAADNRAKFGYAGMTNTDVPVW
jgi:hypothetical protein